MNKVYFVSLPMACAGVGAPGGGANRDDPTASVSVHNPPPRDRHVQPECKRALSASTDPYPLSDHYTSNLLLKPMTNPFNQLPTVSTSN